MTDAREIDERRQRALNRGMGMALNMPWHTLSERMAAFEALGDGE